MAIPADDIIDRASKVVQDTTNVRWPVAELVQWLNDGQREVILHRPDSNPKTAVVTLKAGTRQSLKALTAEGTAGGVGVTVTPAKLLDVIAVATGTGDAVVRTAAIRLVQREVLDSQTAGWHAITGVTAPKHYMFDPRDPLAFYVYPPAASTGASVEVLFSAYPTDIAAPVGEVVSGSIGVADIYGNALLDYVLYRAYSKDSEYAGNAQRAQFHYQSFATSLGIELRGTVAMGPTISGATWNPNSPKMAQNATQN